MRLLSGIVLLLLLPSAPGLRAADGNAPANGNASANANANAPANDAAAAGKKGKKKRPAERLDLNQVDLEQVEEDWDSTPTKPAIDVGNSVKIREIVEPSGEYSYASFGRPDPFAAPAALMDPGANEGVTQTPEGKEIKMTSALQRYPLSDLTVKGVWQLSNGDVRAVILTPKAEGVVVKEGDPISSGKVLSIKREQLIVRLYRLRADGVREYEDVPMKIGATEKNEQGVIKLEPGKEPVFVNPDANRPMPVVPLSRAFENPTAPASAVPAAQAAPAAAAAGTGAAPGAPGVIPAAMPVEKGLDPVVPRTPK